MRVMDLHLNEEAERLAVELASRTGDTVSGAVTRALQSALEKTPPRTPAEIEEKVARILEIGRRSAALPRFDTRDHAEMLYDENGLPA